MLKNNFKFLFYLLLIPFYFNVLVILFFGILSGLAIDLQDFVIYVILNVLGAWLLSCRKNLLLNIGGLLCFLFYGWHLISYIFKGPLYGPGKIVNSIAGTFIIILGLAAFIYDIIKSKKSFNNEV